VAETAHTAVLCLWHTQVQICNSSKIHIIFRQNDRVWSSTTVILQLLLSNGFLSISFLFGAHCDLASLTHTETYTMIWATEGPNRTGCLSVTSVVFVTFVVATGVLT
jgi:hypothetical protein